MTSKSSVHVPPPPAVSRLLAPGLSYKIMVWIPVDNKYYSICISHVIIEILSIIKIISCNIPIDYIHYHTPFFVFVCWHRLIITTEDIFSSTGDPVDTVVG